MNAWNGVVVINKKKHNSEVRCIYCDHKFSGTVSRIRDHFLGNEGKGVKVCIPQNIPDHFLDPLKEEAAAQEAKSKKRKLLQNSVQQTISSGPCKQSTDSAVATFFLAEAIPFCKVDSPYFRKMVDFIVRSSSYTPCCRQTLVTTALNNEYIELLTWVENVSLERVACTLVCDGWKNSAHSPVMVFLQTWTDLALFRNVFDTTGVRRTGQDICKQATVVAETLHPERICQFCSDSGSDRKLGRRLFCATYPWVVDSNCSCHCLDLLVEDIFDIPWAKEIMRKAHLIVMYIRNHNLLRGAFKEDSGVTLLSPCETRFAANIIELDRLNDFKTSVVTVMNSSKADELYDTLSGEPKIKFDEVVRIVRDPHTWEEFTYLLRITIPIHHIIRICEGGKNAVEAVGHIYFLMHELEKFYKTDAAIKTAHRSALGRLLQDRWTMLHSTLMDAGYLLNPVYRQLEPWANEVIMRGFRSLVKTWARFLQAPIASVVAPDLPVESAIREIDDYMDSNLNEKPSSTYVKKLRKPQALYDVLETWNLPSSERGPPQVSATKNTIKSWWRTFGAKWPTLQKLALLLYSQPISQSVAEQSLSGYKALMGPSRKSLSPEGQMKSVFVYYNIRQRDAIRDCLQVSSITTKRKGLFTAKKSDRDKRTKQTPSHRPNVRTGNIEGSTKLHLAAKSGNIELATLLLDEGADINATDSAMYTPFMDAIDKGQDKLAIWMLQQPCIKLSPCIWKFCRDRDMEGILHKARYGNSPRLAVPIDPLLIEAFEGGTSDIKKRIGEGSSESSNSRDITKDVTQDTLASECDYPVSPGEGSFEKVAKGISKILQKSSVLNTWHEKDPSLLIGLLNFLKHVDNGNVEEDFLPFRTFIDAVNKRSSMLGNYRHPPPHREDSLFFGMSLDNEPVGDNTAGYTEHYHTNTADQTEQIHIKTEPEEETETKNIPVTCNQWDGLYPEDYLKPDLDTNDVKEETLVAEINKDSLLNFIKDAIKSESTDRITSFAVDESEAH